MTDIVDLVSNLVNGFLQMILDFVIYIVNLILLPIDAIISSMIPNFVDLAGYINSALNVASQYIGYCLDSLGMYSSTVYLLVGALSLKIAVPLSIWVMKLAIRWYNALKT